MQETNDTNQTEVTSHDTEAADNNVSHRNVKKSRMSRYVAVAVVILAIAAALLYALELQGRISTGLFGDMAGNQAAVYVNGEKIAQSDFDSSVNQLIQMATAQGIDVTNEATVSEYRNQALDTLINGELLRQAAVKAGITATEEAITDRFEQIKTDVGGEEMLSARMAEFGITEAVLRRDIENEILIQGLFDASFPADEMEVTDDEVNELYEQISSGGQEVPPLDDIRSQIIEQIKYNRQQTEVSNLLDTLRNEAEIDKRV